MRKKLAVLFAIVVVLIATVPAANRAIDYTTLVANQSGNFTWATTAPTGSSQLVTAARYRALVVNATPGSCPLVGATGSRIVDWNAVVSCASSHTASLQSEGVSGNYSTIYYTSTFDSGTGEYICHGPFGSDSYSGSPITLPAGTVAPSGSTPLALTLSSITYPGSTSITVQLKNPAGTAVQTWSTISTSSWSSGNYTTAGAAGAWSWVITDNGGSGDGTCDPGTGASGGGTQMTFSGTATWYQ